MSERRMFDIESYEKIDPMEPKNYAVCWSIVDWTHEDPKVGDKFKVTEIDPETETVVSKEMVEAAERVVEAAADWLQDTEEECNHNPGWQILSEALKQYQEAKEQN